MSEEELDREVLQHVGMDRRTFIKRVVLGTAFAIPVIASFPMSGLGAGSGGGQPSNQGPLGRNISSVQPEMGGDVGPVLRESAKEGYPLGKELAPGQRRR